MIRRYLLASLKKNPGRSLFPLVYLLPLLVLVFLNTISLLGTPYQQYCFHTNSNFVSLCNTTKESGRVFAPYTLPLFGGYSDALSAGGTPYYETVVPAMIYFYQEEDAVQTSYFTERNLLSGSLPDAQMMQSLRQRDRYPICVTYGIARASDTQLGERLDLSVSVMLPTGEGEFEESVFTLQFEVVGILCPDGYGAGSDNGGESKASFACALVPPELFSQLPSYFQAGQPNYYLFSNDPEEPEAEGQSERITREEMLESIVQSVDKRWALINLGMIGVIVAVLCWITHAVFRTRNASDMETLSKMGLSRTSIAWISFSQAGLALLLSVVLSCLFVGFVYLPYVAKQYYNGLFFALFAGGVLLVGGFTCLACAFIRNGNSGRV